VPLIGQVRPWWASPNVPGPQHAPHVDGADRLCRVLRLHTPRCPRDPVYDLPRLAQHLLSPTTLGGDVAAVITLRLRCRLLSGAWFASGGDAFLDALRLSLRLHRRSTAGVGCVPPLARVPPLHRRVMWVVWVGGYIERTLMVDEAVGAVSRPRLHRLSRHLLPSASFAGGSAGVTTSRLRCFSAANDRIPDLLPARLRTGVYRRQLAAGRRRACCASPPRSSSKGSTLPVPAGNFYPESGARSKLVVTPDGVRRPVVGVRPGSGLPRVLASSRHERGRNMIDSAPVRR